MVCPGNGCSAHGGDIDSCGILNSAFVLAGLAMMLNIRLSYSSAPYALIRFRLPENLFSVFVRRMASALELWCLPSMLLGNIMDLFQKGVFDNIIGTTAAQKLQKAAGTGSSAGKLRKLAETLYTQASALNTEVKKAGTSSDNDKNAAKVLRAKAGTSDQTPGTLRFLAKDLYKAAEALRATASGDDGKAQGLATAVGQESSSSGLAKALKELGNHIGTADQLTDLAKAVTDAYGSGGSGVQKAYNDVVDKKTTYTGDKEALYEAVEKAMTAFNAVYKPEELFMNAVGSTGQGLQGALATLGSAPNDHTLPDKAKNVKDKFAGWGTGVKSIFQLVKDQVPAYEADGSNIKTSQYTPLEQAFKAFNDKYHDAISSDKFNITVIPSIICQWLNFLTYVILLYVYVIGGENGHLTVFYFVIAISGVVFGINMTLVYAVDWQYITVYIAGENCFPALTSFIHYITTLIFGNRRKWNSDFIVVCVDIVVAIIISLAAAVMWTLGYAVFKDGPGGEYGHIHAHGFTSDIYPDMVSPFLMIVVGMGLVYAIYPGIAPGMIVPFYLIDKIEMVLLIATIFPPMIVVMLQITDKKSGWGNPKHSPKAYGGWKGHSLRFWHFVDLLIVIKISLAGIFIYSLHYRDSSISRAIINQPKMSTFLSITFYMCHEFLLAIGFAGQVSNGAEYTLIPQYIGALFMIFLAFYSEGYIIEYKSHDPAH